MPTTPQPQPQTYAHRSLGELAREISGATALFRQHRLDFCCGGDQTLEAAARAQGIDVGMIETQLAALDQQSAAGAQTPDDVGSLIEHIVSRFHEGHRRDLPELIALAAKVEQVHAAHPAVPAGLTQLLQTMRDELEAHMHKEEQILFPLMRRNPAGFLAPPIARMRQEHEDHGRMLQDVQQLTAGLRLPPGACATWQALYAGLGRFTDELMQHVHTENNILFPQFEAAAQSAVATFPVETTPMEPLHLINQPHAHRRADRTYAFDASGIAKRFRHAAIFGALTALEPGETMAFFNDHDPIPLLQQIERHFGERVRAEYVSRSAEGVRIDFHVQTAA
jgi:regulator of cell morphogenesis and NO signaling